ncbi:DUF2281 domain-containing protein [Leptolyngbya cf. ectocarpi LEGE 11479]|uniref:DUF2281 domain-containing protein n=1 Tax=Leptolyngbya cf. ectocarpi LEGE 11479 TaxID=1828722 RepID=A0A929FB24_LEPEC|nr:DUF2281 domain-containing protein [Leptolyngbya ectocarpi]MBE9070386.1 DUF2281 domain-containing protein [Leptolyngbya cf. ectocarpi LEGE 11479]
MTIREITIAKLQQLPSVLLQEVNDFIDFLSYKHQPWTKTKEPQASITETWAQWFTAVDHLPIKTTESAGDYQQHLLSKYRKQGLEL